MMCSPIPKKVRDLLNDDLYMSRCARESTFCSGRIEWHHAFTYGGRRQNEPWCLIPLCHVHHSTAGYKTSVPIINKQIRARIKHFKAESDFRAEYPRSKLLTDLPKRVPLTP